LPYGPFDKQDEVYELAHKEIIQIMGEELFGKPTLSQSDWLSYLDKHFWALDEFNETLKQAAKRAYPKHFLTVKERKSLLQSSGIDGKEFFDPKASSAGKKATSSNGPLTDEVARNLFELIIDKIENRDKTQVFLIWLFAGSGTGKSHLARKLSALLGERGYRTDFWDCREVDSKLKRSMLKEFDIIIQESTISELNAEERSCVDVAVRLQSNRLLRGRHLTKAGKGGAGRSYLLSRGDDVDAKDASWQDPDYIIRENGKIDVVAAKSTSAGQPASAGTRRILANAINVYQQDVAQARAKLYEKMSPPISGERKLSDEDFDFDFVLKDIETTAFKMKIKTSKLVYKHFAELCKVARERGVEDKDLTSNFFNIFDYYLYAFTSAWDKLLEVFEQHSIPPKEAFELVYDNETKDLGLLVTEIMTLKHALQSRVSQNFLTQQSINSAA